MAPLGPKLNLGGMGLQGCLSQACRKGGLSLRGAPAFMTVLAVLSTVLDCFGGFDGSGERPALFSLVLQKDRTKRQP